MPQNIPIRLVHVDGNLTEIMATSVALDIERKVGGISIPYAGGTRGGFDLNRSSASIIIEGIISDDDIISTYSSAVASSAIIDFSVSHRSATIDEIALNSWLPTVTVANSMTITGSTRITSSNATDARQFFHLTDYDGTSYRINMVSNNGAVANHRGISSDNYYIGIYNHASGVAGTSVEIADNLFDLINNDSVLQTKFTATKETSAITNEASTQIRITQVTKGSNGDNLTPRFTDISQPVGTTPFHAVFTGGRGASAADSDDYWVQKSAGDKVMDLFGILNNSENSRSRTHGWIDGYRIAANKVLGTNIGSKYGDYIIAIQIPFNSMATAGASEKYSARNFYMPTGASHFAWEKGATKSEPATTEFKDTWLKSGDYSGIKGAVQKATFTQLGGEPVFSFTIVFVPIDLIW
jgi:hypothetical protein